MHMDESYMYFRIDRVDTKVSLVTDLFHFEFDEVLAAVPEHGLNVFLCGALTRIQLPLS